MSPRTFPSRLGEDALLLLAVASPAPASGMREAADLGTAPCGSGQFEPCHEEDPANSGHRRRQLAILAADVVGYSRMMEQDELRTALRVRHLHQQLVQPTVQRHAGRIFSTAGDGMMAAFTAVADAVGCAVAIQRALDLAGGDQPAPDHLRLRVGISAGSVLVVDGELYGCALNVAARLEALAAPGNIYVSGAAFDQVGDPGHLRFEPLGERKLAKLTASTRVYRVDWDRHRPGLQAGAEAMSA